MFTLQWLLPHFLKKLGSIYDCHKISAYGSVQLLSQVQLFATPRTAARQASLSIINSWSLLKLMSIKSVMPSNHLILHHPLLLPTFNLSQNQGIFQGVTSLHQWPKYWSLSFSLSPSNEYAGLISFRIDWFDLLVVQGILKSFLQHHRIKLQHMVTSPL